MIRVAIPPKTEFKRLTIRQTVEFAINNLPQVDPTTLEKFLTLVYASGHHGSLTAEEIQLKMGRLLRYVPDSCPYSLLILADLLEMEQKAGPRETVGVCH